MFTDCTTQGDLTAEIPCRRGERGLRRLQLKDSLRRSPQTEWNTGSASFAYIIGPLAVKGINLNFMST